MKYAKLKKPAQVGGTIFAVGISERFVIERAQRTARASWHWHFGCQPITIGTVLGMLLAMWFPPLSFLAALGWAIAHIADGGGFAFIHYELTNPCKWFRRSGPGDAPR